MNRKCKWSYQYEYNNTSQIFFLWNFSAQMENYRQKARLTVYNIKEEDFGAYKCVSKNSLGETESTVRLYGQLYGTYIRWSLRICLWRKTFSDSFLHMVTAMDLNKCLKQIKLPKSLHTCASLSELPSTIITMVSRNQMTIENIKFLAPKHVS